MLLESLQQSLFRDKPQDAIHYKKIARSIDTQAGGLDIVLNRTHPVVKPLVLSSSRLDVQPEDKTKPTAIAPGKIWEVVIAQHPEQALMERNQTLLTRQ